MLIEHLSYRSPNGVISFKSSEYHHFKSHAGAPFARKTSPDFRKWFASPLSNVLFQLFNTGKDFGGLELGLACSVRGDSCIRTMLLGIITSCAAGIIGRLE